MLFRSIKKQNKIKNILKVLTAFTVLVFLWIFINDSTYNIIKKPFIKNSDKYIEMYAYTKTKPSFTNKYFIVQENDSAKSFFRGEAKFVSENNLNTIDCSEEDAYILYEKPSDKINNFVLQKGGETFTLNQGMNVEFYAVKLNKENADSCNLGR